MNLPSRLPTNNIAPTLVGLAALALLVPLMLLLIYLAKAGLGSKPFAWALRLWDPLEEFSHARPS
jgi:hypothetical protein